MSSQSRESYFWLRNENLKFHYMLWSTPLSFSIAIVKLVFFSYVRIYFQGFFAVFFDDNFGITLLNLFLSFFKCDHVRTKDILIV